LKLDRVMIAGGSEEGRYLAHLLEERGVQCIILDRDKARCLELSETLRKSLVLHGDATDLELLEAEGAGSVDGFVAATGNDETNILSSLCAKTLGAREVVSLVHRFGYRPIVPRVGIDASVSPRLSTANAILRYVRRGQVTAVATLADIEAEVIEFHVSRDSKAAGKSLSELHMARAGVVGTVIRGDRIFLPKGDDRLFPGDEVIVFALPGHIREIERLFD
jgi:trk system potassium uptake protein TrkA